MHPDYPHWTSGRGFSGRILEPEDFVVKEIIDAKYLRRFSHSTGSVQKGYFLYLLKKRNLTTKQALHRLVKKFNFRESIIGYAGLKDKFAVTEQYITMKADVADFDEGNISLKKIKTTDKFMARGDNLGNEFVITLHGAKFNEALLKELLAKPMPNYFGCQRFGNRGTNHLIGKALVKNNYAAALKLLNEGSARTYASLRDVKKEELKFFIHAYQSFLFNELLRDAVKKNLKLTKLKLPGFDTTLENSPIDKLLAARLKKDGVNLEDFKKRDLSLACAGSAREAFISVPAIEYTVAADSVKLSFCLPPGSYATVLLHEVCKN